MTVLLIVLNGIVIWVENWTLIGLLDRRNGDTTLYRNVGLFTNRNDVES